MKKIIYVLLVFLVSSLYAQSEYIVNTYKDSTQRDPQIARDSQGNYVIVWTSLNQISVSSADEIYLQKFNSQDQLVGTEELVNTVTDKNQERPAIAMNGSGTFVIVWASFSDYTSIYDIKARLYKNNLPVGNEFLVNTTTLHSQTNPDVTIDNNGNFVITWDSWYQDGSNKGVYAQRFDVNGTKVGSEFQVNTTTLNSQQRPAIKSFANGSFLITWESWKQDSASPSGYGVYGKIFNSNGDVVKDEFALNTYVNNYQWFGDFAIDNNNNIIAVWCSWEQDGDDGGIYLQKFDLNGNKIGGEILVNKTTLHYQWLPKVGVLSNGNIAVLWSSWLTDGDREGVYAIYFNSDLEKISFETKVNDFSNSYQWEPVFIPKEDNKILAVYSSWGIDNNDYEIVAKLFEPTFPQAIIEPTTYINSNGNNTSKIIVHVVDSTLVTNNNYEITYTEVGTKQAAADIVNTTTNTTVVNDYPITAGENVFYITPNFEGIAVEFKPEFDFALDLDNSTFINNSGTNINFQVVAPSSSVVLAPIDCRLAWGNCDTLSNGKYVTPLDSAYSTSGIREVEVPFIVTDITNNEKMRLFISEPNATKNKKWDPGETLTLLTPAQYQSSFPDYHASVKSVKPVGNIVYPNTGDIQNILTTRPIKTGDKVTFTVNHSLITTEVNDESLLPNKFELKQNYPNPFNPSTTISFTIPKDEKIKLEVFNILGQKVATLVNDFKTKGTYKVNFNGSNLASGVYLYSLQYGKNMLTKKMVLLK